MGTPTTRGFAGPSITLIELLALCPLKLQSMDSSKHSSKLEPFLLMAKSAKGAAAARLIEDATTAPGVFVFGELLELGNMQEVS
jgi:hypothetical protein